MLFLKTRKMIRTNNTHIQCVTLRKNEKARKVEYIEKSKRYLSNVHENRCLDKKNQDFFCAVDFLIFTVDSSSDDEDDESSLSLDFGVDLLLVDFLGVVLAAVFSPVADFARGFLSDV